MCDFSELLAGWIQICANKIQGQSDFKKKPRSLQSSTLSLCYLKSVWFETDVADLKVAGETE